MYVTCVHLISGSFFKQDSEDVEKIIYVCNWYFSSLGVTDDTFPLDRSIFTFQVEIILFTERKSLEPIELSN